MVFGKRKRVDDVSLNSNFEDEDSMMYENYSINDDEDVEEIEIIDKETTSNPQTNNITQSEKRVDPNFKPLLEEVTLKGVASGKNPGGAKQ